MGRAKMPDDERASVQMGVRMTPLTRGQLDELAAHLRAHSAAQVIAIAVDELYQRLRERKQVAAGRWEFSLRRLAHEAAGDEWVSASDLAERLRVPVRTISRNMSHWTNTKHFEKRATLIGGRATVQYRRLGAA